MIAKSSIRSRSASNNYELLVVITPCRKSWELYLCSITTLSWSKRTRSSNRALQQQSELKPPCGGLSCQCNAVVSWVGFWVFFLFFAFDPFLGVFMLFVLPFFLLIKLRQLSCLSVQKNISTDCRDAHIAHSKIIFTILTHWAIKFYKRYCCRKFYISQLFWQGYSNKVLVFLMRGDTYFHNDAVPTSKVGHMCH
jgi:hypothetical protein